MGFYLQIDEDPMQPIASNSGWGDVIEWVGKLPAHDSVGLQHLCRFGWQEDAKLVLVEAKAALKDHAPKSEQTVMTVENLISLLEKHEGKITVLTVTNGLGI